VYLYSAETREPLRNFWTGSFVSSIAFSPDGSLLAAGLMTGDIVVWKTADGKILHTLTAGRSYDITGLAFRPDGRTLLSASHSGWIVHWNAVSGARLKEVSFSGTVNSSDRLVFSPGAGKMAWARPAGIIFFDPGSGEAVQKLSLGTEDIMFVNAAFSPDGRRFAVAADTGTIRAWDIADGGLVLEVASSADYSHGLAFSPDSEFLAVRGGDDASLVIWEIRTGGKKGILRDPPMHETMLAFLPGGDTLVSASGTLIVFWSVEEQTVSAVLGGFSTAVNQVAFSPDGGRLASAVSDGTIVLWDPATGERVQVLRGHTDSVTDLAYSPDGKHLASASEDRKVFLWDLEDGTFLPVPGSYETGSPYLSVVFSPDARTLAVGSGGGIELWSVPDMKRTVIAQSASYSDQSVVFSPDGSMLAFADEEKVNLWDLAGGRFILSREVSVQGGGARVMDLAFSPDGKMLVSSIYDGSVVWWDIAAGGAYQRKKYVEDPDAFGPIKEIDFSPDGRMLAGVTERNYVVFWDSAGEGEARVWLGHAVLPQGISTMGNGISFSPIAKTLATGACDGTIILWDIEEIS
jgi:WD40 repeat protein